MEIRLQRIPASASFAPKKNNDSGSFCFSGLTKTAKKHIFLEPKFLQQINGVNNKETIGELPAEFILALKEAGCPKERTGEEIKKLMNSFTLAAMELREAEKTYLEKQDFQVLEFARMLDDALERHSYLDLQRLFQKLLRIQALNSTFDPVLEKSASCIDKAFKEAGILPEDGKAQVDFLLEGGRGYAFKVSFLDADDKQVFHDKILKLYRSPMSDVAAHLAKTVHSYTCERPKEYFGLCKDRMSKYYMAHVNSLSNPYNLDPNTLVDIKTDDYMLLIEDFQRKYRGKSIEELYHKYNDFVNDFVGADISHGVCAEANTSMFLKDKVGNIQEFNYIEPWFFNLKKGYSLFEFSDSKLPKPKKELDLGKYRLYHSDLQYNPGNVVEGRVIDYGGITKISR